MKSTEIKHIGRALVLGKVDITNRSGASSPIAGVLKSVSELAILKVWVDPEQLVSTARIILAGHKLKALGVVEGKKLIGVLTPARLSSVPGDVMVGEVMDPVQNAIDPSTSTRDAAQLMADENLDFLPVVSNEQFLGVISGPMLLRELGRTWDPLTGLSWSDLLRDWAIDQLANNREVTVLFLDLDDFGSYNRRFGHVIGDRVLRRVATYLRSFVHPENDVVVRFGGDEFAIATTRSRYEAEQLLEAIENGNLLVDLDGHQDTVRFSVGIFGGRRTKERENIHLAATIDDLINQASRDALAKKLQKKEERLAMPTLDPTELKRFLTTSVKSASRNDDGEHLVNFEVDGVADSWRMTNPEIAPELAVAQAVCEYVSAKWPPIHATAGKAFLSALDASSALVEVQVAMGERETQVSWVRSISGEQLTAFSTATLEAIRTGVRRLQSV